MPYNKQAIAVNFSQGLETKTDPWQVPIGKFLALDNSVFTKRGMLLKRNGYQTLPSLPSNTFAYLTTLNDNLTALGFSIGALSEGSNMWVSKGSIQPMQVSTLPLIRNNINQIQCDAAIAPNGLVCTVYTESNGVSSDYKYAIADSITGQNITEPTLIIPSAGSVSGSPRVFLLGAYFVIVFTALITATSHLQYVAIPVNMPEQAPTAAQDIAASYVATQGLSWDGVVSQDNLYIAYDTLTGGQAVKVTYLSMSSAAAGNPPVTAVTFAGFKADLMSLTTETISNNPIIYVSFYNASTVDGYTLAVNAALVTIFSPQTIYTATTTDNITSAAQNGVCTVFYEVDNNYSYDSSTPTHYINAVIITSAGVVGSPYTVVRSVGLGSKAFIVNGTLYFLASYQSPFQPTYFLINGSESIQASPVISAKLAYENGGGYLTYGLPGVTINDNAPSYASIQVLPDVAPENSYAQVQGILYQFLSGVWVPMPSPRAQVPYLFKDLIAALSNANAAGTSTVGGIYSQTGINLGTFDITTLGTDSSEIGKVLQFSGGFLWMYDGYLPVEHNFFLWPDSVEVTTSTTGGHLADQEYFYQAVYEWSDNQGNIYRSAGSVPVSITTAGGGTSTNTVFAPTLRLTYKTANPVKITIYRWSTGLQIWYEITSIIQPVLNSTTTDSITYVDTASDSSISGNSILYTTGGVIEDINAPATNIMTLFDTRFWMVDAEDQNLLWFSKQVIEATPVEMSDLLTFYVAPTTGSEGSTGPITALAPLDDKLIIFKENAIYYINGTGPDNTGANNQYSQPIFVTSTVGCANQQSIVFMPQGLMFQSNKGIWLLGRDLSTEYVGAPVEKYNGSLVQSAVNVPETNQVRFTLNTGQTLMFDYYYMQWGTFSGVPAISSTIYKGFHTFINAQGFTYQEEPGVYLDGAEPVLMSFTTSWINPAGLQGYQRAYFFYLLGQYYSPHKLQLGIAYNYNPAVTQVSTIKPVNFSTPFGSGPSQSPFGQQTPFGGPAAVEDWRVFLAQQRCQSFQITLNEYYDPSFNVPAGAGLTISGLNLVVGISKDYRPGPVGQSVGGGTNRG